MSGVLLYGLYRIEYTNRAIKSSARTKVVNQKERDASYHNVKNVLSHDVTPFSVHVDASG